MIRGTFIVTLVAIVAGCLAGCSGGPTITREAILGKWQAPLDAGWEYRNVFFQTDGSGYVFGNREALGLGSARIDFTYEIDPKDNVVRIYPKGDKEHQGTARLLSESELEMKVDAFGLVFGGKCVLHHIIDLCADRTTNLSGVGRTLIFGELESAMLDECGQEVRPLL